MKKLLTTPRFLALVIVILLVNLFLANHTTVLWEEDEAAYAGFARTMLETGDWTVPDFPWSKIHRKTPLHFWMIAASYKVFGINEFATRVPSVLSILLLFLSIWGLGRRYFGDLAAKAAILVLASTLFVPNIGKIGVTDAPLLLFQTTAILSLFLFLKEGKQGWNLLFWTCIAMGLLQKGPPILILTGGVWLTAAIFHPERKKLIGTHPWIFLPLACLPLFGWGWVAWQRDGGIFISWLFDWYVLQRLGMSTEVTKTWTGPPGYHFVILLGSFLPWLIFLPAALRDAWKALRRKESDYILLAGWLFWAWLFYEIMPSKLPAYSLAAHPAIALILALFLVKPEEERLDSQNIIKTSGILSILLVFFATSGMMLLLGMMFKAPGMVRAMPLSFAAWGGGIIGIIAYMLRKESVAIAAAIFVGMSMTFFAWIQLLPIIEKARSVTKNTALKANEHCLPNSPVHFHLSPKNDVPGLSFYFMDYFGNQYITKEQAVLENLLQSPGPAVVVLDERTFPDFRSFLAADSSDLYQVDSLKGLGLDRMKQTTYFVLSNGAAQR